VVTERNPGLKNKLGFFPVPGKTAGRPGSVFIGGSDLVVPAASGEQDAAFTFIKELTGDTWQRRLALAMSNAPSTTALAGAVASGPGSPVPGGRRRRPAGHPRTRPGVRRGKPAAAVRVLGTQVQPWTEFTATPERLEHLTHPVCAPRRTTAGADPPSGTTSAPASNGAPPGSTHSRSAAIPDRHERTVTAQPDTSPLKGIRMTSRTRPNRMRIAAASAAAVAMGTAGLAAVPATARAATAGITVQYRTSATGATADQAEPWLKVRNTGDGAVQLSTVKVRYYFKADSAATSYRFACSWAVRGCAGITGAFGTLTHPTATADRYLEIGFTPGAGILAPGADTGDMQLRFYRSDWQTLRQSDDYSFGPSQSAYADWPKATARLSGNTVWGTAPEGNDPADPPSDPPTGGQSLFDDFDYTASSDPRIAANGWTVRSNAGGPGVPGATWAPENVTFATSAGNSVMNLRTSTAGTATSTRQTEVLTKATKFKNGTYAARVKFSDAPLTGPDGDHLVQTFFTINDLTAPMADDYSEYDFEYLPNGGWGEPSNILYTTSWETYNPDPWQAVNQHTEARQSFAGWHDLVLTIDNSTIAYYVDGSLFGTHDAAYLPERPMSINFNQWLIDLAGQTGTTARAYDQQVDYVLHVKDQVLTPAQVAAKVASYRAAGTTFEDTVPTG
jgi:cellulose binding protein with CBM3 domain